MIWTRPVASTTMIAQQVHEILTYVICLVTAYQVEWVLEFAWSLLEHSSTYSSHVMQYSHLQER